MGFRARGCIANVTIDECIDVWLYGSSPKVKDEQLQIFSGGRTADKLIKATCFGKTGHFVGLSFAH